MDKTDKSIN
jgi:hypothetical protein